jgi:hypothetical protein
MFGALTTVALVIAAPLPPPPDYQKMADETKWEWAPERASLTWYLTRFQGDYQAEVEPNTFGRPTVRFSKDGKAVLTLGAHSATGFVLKGHVLYYTEYHPSATGCALVAYDLANRKEMWKTRLKGLGLIGHFDYLNHVALELTGNAVKVVGHETAGDYVEFVDLRTGKTAGHRIFRKRFGP